MLLMKLALALRGVGVAEDRVGVVVSRGRDPAVTGLWQKCYSGLSGKSFTGKGERPFALLLSVETEPFEQLQIVVGRFFYTAIPMNYKGEK